jgi:predicted RNase H-like HicB family nuclease
MSSEIIFEVHQEEDGGFCTRALGYCIFTQGHTWEELKANVREATECYFEDEKEKPKIIILHLVRDEVIPLETPAKPVRKKARRNSLKTGV